MNWIFELRKRLFDFLYQNVWSELKQMVLLFKNRHSKLPSKTKIKSDKTDMKILYHIIVMVFSWSSRLNLFLKKRLTFVFKIKRIKWFLRTIIFMIQLVFVMKSLNILHMWQLNNKSIGSKSYCWGSIQSHSREDAKRKKRKDVKCGYKKLDINAHYINRKTSIKSVSVGCSHQKCVSGFRL